MQTLIDLDIIQLDSLPATIMTYKFTETNHCVYVRVREVVYMHDTIKTRTILVEELFYLRWTN